MKSFMEKKYSYMIYSLVVALISIILWWVGGSFALPIFMISAGAMLLYFNDFKYFLPFLMNFVFVNGTNASARTIDIGLIIGVVFLIIVIISYVVRNKIKFRLNKFGIPFLILAIGSILPLFWKNETINNGAMYFLFFNWFCYLLIYVFVSSCIKSDLKEELTWSGIGLAILLSFECIISVIRIKIQGGSLNDIYSLGWGICNEAGIILCMVVPFIFYKIISTNLKNEIIFWLGILLFVSVGVFATQSRGTYLFYTLEIGLFIMYLLFVNKKYAIISILFILGSTAGLLLVVKYNIVLLEKVIRIIDDNGRIQLYQSAINLISKSPVKTFFGSGFVSEIDFEGRVVVYHSTIYETLVTTGIIGMGVLIVHIAQKYYHTFKYKMKLTNMMIIGFIVVDLYGLIDNTYHMYYYMIILSIILAVIENIKGCEQK